MNIETILLDVIIIPLQLGLWALFWAYWFDLKSIRRIARIVWALTALLTIGMAMIRPPLGRDDSRRIHCLAAPGGGRCSSTFSTFNRSFFIFLSNTRGCYSKYHRFYRIDKFKFVKAKISNLN